MPGTTRLQLYNDALLLCGERSLASLTEERKPRRLLDQVWDGDGVGACLEAGQWQFAARTQQIYSDPSLEPPFGFQYGFQKPDDWVLTCMVCQDEFFRVPLISYRDEITYWLADMEPIYVSFVSDDEDYGGDLSRWPRSFCDYAAAYFASRIVHDLTGDEKKRAMILQPDVGILDKALKKAKSRAAMTQATQFPRPGAWIRSRGGWGGTRNDGGSTSNLIG